MNFFLATYRTLFPVACLILCEVTALAADPPFVCRYSDGTKASAEVTRSFELFNEAFNTACRQRSVDAMLILYADDVEWVAPGAAPAQGKEAPRAGYTRIFSDPARLLHHEISVAWVAADGSLATLRGNYLLKIDGRPTLLRGAYFLGLRRIDSQWRIVTDAFLPPENEATP